MAVPTDTKTFTEQLLFGDNQYSQILEGYWRGHDAHEIAQWLGESSAFIARVMDDFRSLGY
jgi:hypothetical protein